ncbi:MAG: hypothetical protein GF308_03015 [Candidatus Heimdallarchaeota archaeon]|nr:hypothetical protein [Candidatus Heimdallarchaeota archaeon]
MKCIILKEKRWGTNEYHLLEAAIKEAGDLVFEGVDSGDSVKERYGDFDFEYWYKVRADQVPKVLLFLLQEKFEKTSEIIDWLKEKDIPFESYSF